MTLRECRAHYQTNRVTWLLSGTKNEENGTRIASVSEWHQRVNYLHSIAKEGCPFAASTMYLIENKIEQIIEIIENEKAKIKDIAAGISIKSDYVTDKVYHMKTWAPIGIRLVSVLCKYDRLLHEIHVVMFSGEINRIEIQKLNSKVEKVIREIKHRPYQYKDLGIRSEDFKGSLEWEAGVKRLGSEPDTGPYRPNYYLNDNSGSRSDEREDQLVRIV